MTDDKLSDRLVRKMYGDKLLNTVSRLEQYAKCPFSHFATYGLRANEREMYEITMPQLGMIFHRVIELFSKRISERELSWDEVIQAIRLAWIGEMVESALLEEQHQVFLSSERNQYRIKRLIAILDKTIEAIGFQISRGNFEPAEAEWQFKGDDSLEALNLSLNGDREMCLLGTIDRVDKLSKDGVSYLTVIDYKSSSKDMDYGDVYNGLQLQLLLYLNAAIEVTSNAIDNEEVKPAGIFFTSRLMIPISTVIYC